MGAPQAPGKHPAVLICHGGGASAEQLRPAVEDWARLGYVALAFDNPGIGGRQIKSKGPWDEKSLGIWTFPPDSPENRLFDSVVAGLNAFALLKSQDNVDSENIGITGGSWGGYMTTMLCGLLGDQVKAAFAAYGGGFYDQGTVFMADLAQLPEPARQRWLSTLDPGRYAGNIEAAFFGAYAANDWFFWPESVMKTYNAIRSHKQLVFSPNTSHGLNFAGGNLGASSVDQFQHRALQEVDWMNYYLKNEGDPFPECQVSGKPSRKGKFLEVAFQAASSYSIVSAKVWYSYGDTPWRTRNWLEADVEITRKGYLASIPVEEIDQPIDWFALVSDSRDISVSTPMARMVPSAYGFRRSDGKPSYFTEDFEFLKVGRRWPPSFPQGASKRGTFAFTGEAAHHGTKGLKLTGAITMSCHGIRGNALSDPDVEGIRFWVKSASDTGYTVELSEEDTDGNYLVWENHQDAPGSNWTEVTIPWDDFSPASGNPSKGHFIPSADLAKLSLTAPEGAELYFDSFETITR